MYVCTGVYHGIYKARWLLVWQTDDRYVNVCHDHDSLSGVLQNM